MDINTKNIAVLFHGKLRDKELPYRNDISCLVLRHFNDNYPNFNIDYFGHIWCENNLDYTCYGNNIISEKIQIIMIQLIWHIINVSMY